MTPSEQGAEVLAYYQRERDGQPEEKPLAGLSLEAFRAVRARLVERGLVVRSVGGRYMLPGGGA